MSTFGEKARKLRKSKNMTTRMLAEEIESSYGQISKYENNKSDPTLNVLRKYRDYFKVSLDYLCDDNKE
jgi:transcriptional regulator with XRE-family HTH domain